MQLRCPRGTRDLWGDELATARFVVSKMRSVFERFGFQEVQTPIFEHLELFLVKSGSEIIKQIYDFEDKSGRKLALRPELTAPAIRFFIQHLKRNPPPVRLFYFGECFRYEEPQAWRWREFTQAGCEIIGSPNPQADAEVISLTCEIMREVGMNDWKLRIGDVGILRNVLASVGVKEEKQDPILRAVDSGNRNRILEELRKAGVPEEEYERLLKIFSLRGDFRVFQKLSEFDIDESMLERSKELLRILREAGEKFEIDLGIARGLDYYTGTVFEVYVGDVQVAGGGRYDTLVERLGGPKTPATGVGFGVDRISSLLLKDGKAEKPIKPLVYVVPLERDLLPKALEISNMLRRKGIVTEMEVMERSLQKALSHADSMGMRFAVIVGRREVSAGQVALRDLKTKKQETVKIEELVSALKSVA
ncbi:MAG: histidine--tRNA ligase [Candidatus Hadarchaeales archaeon]